MVRARWRVVAAVGVCLIAVLVGSVSLAHADTSTALPFALNTEPWLAVDPVGQHVFVSGGHNTSSIVVLDFAGNIVKTINNEPGASQMVVDPSTHTLYVALRDAEAISKIDTQTLSETTRFSTALVGAPYTLALAGGKLWFSCTDSATQCVASVNPDGAGLTNALPGYPDPMRLAAGGPNDDLLALADAFVEPSTVALYDVTGGTPTFIRSTQGPGGASFASDLAFDPPGDNLLLAAGGPSAVQSLPTGTLLPDFDYPTTTTPTAVAMTADGKYVAAGADGSPNVAVFPVGSTTPAQAWTVNGLVGASVTDHGIAFSPDDSRLFVLANNVTANAITFYALNLSLPAYERTLTVADGGGGSGAVTSSPTGIDCGTTCHYRYPLGSQVTLTAAPAAGSTFTGWSGGGCSGTGTCRVTMSADQTVTATFSPARVPKSCVVPKLKGKTVNAAKRALKSHYCSLGKVKRSFSNTVKKGLVISQKPKPRTRLQQGAKINLIVSRGRRA